MHFAFSKPIEHSENRSFVAKSQLARHSILSKLIQPLDAIPEHVCLGLRPMTY